MDLSLRAKTLWGKKKIDKNTKQEMWLPLIVHLIDTQNTIEYLYENWLNDLQRQLLQVSNDEEDTRKLVRFLGGIHDIGKATPAFQTKKSYDNSEELDRDLIEKLERVGFNNLSHLEMASPKATPHNIAGARLLTEISREDKLNISVAGIINAHHGWYEEDMRAGKIRGNKNNYFQSNDMEPVWRDVQNEIIDYILKRAGYENLAEVPKVNEAQVVILTGLVTMADWLASGEYLGKESEPMFSLIPLDKGVDDLNLEERFENAMTLWDAQDNWEPNAFLEASDYYKKYWSFEPREVQRKTTEFVKSLKNPSFVIIESGTGSGKTELALTLAEILSAEKGADGVFFALPTQATTNAMFQRVTEWLTTITKSEDIKTAETLLHGKAQFNKEYNDLPQLSGIDDNEGGVGTQSWFSGKKSILSKFNVGTIDHILSMGLAQRHLFLKHLGLSGKVVILDEVHAYDAYMGSYLEKVLNWLAAYHVPVIALSATLPKETRKKLLESYYKYQAEDMEISDIEDNSWQENTSYPLVTAIDGKQIVQFDNFTKSIETNIKVERLNDDIETVAKSALKKVENGGIAGIIVNTVKRAQEIYEQIPKEIPTIILHSAFLATDREKIEQKLQQAIGKRGKRPDKMIVIGTQVLEQSLDIDFDVLFTDIAPMDLLLQRIGRLHRHQRVRPTGLEEPVVYVLDQGTLGEYGDANESIYEKYILTKTDYFLPKVIVSPKDISTLVQKVYEETKDKIVPNLQELKEAFDINKNNKITKAETYQIEYPKFEELNPLNELIDGKPMLDLKDEQKAQATVRDIKETIEVILLKEDEEGEIELIDGRKLRDATSKEIAQQLIRLPHSVTYDVGKTIDVLESETQATFPEWQQDNWLRGSLALVLNKDNKIKFNEKYLEYSSLEGLKLLNI